MFLKRLIFTTLGLVGLLGFGTVMGQGDGLAGNGGIPAPKLYDGSADCTPTTQSVTEKRRVAGQPLSASLLNSVIGTSSTAAIDLNATITIGTATLQNADLVATVIAGADCADNPVATGLTTANTLWSAADAAQTAAKPVGNTPADPALVKAYTDALAARNAYGGDIYNKVYTQFDREKAARDAITKWNELVDTGGSFVKAQGDYNALAITPVGNTGLVARQGATEGSYGANQIEGFQGITGFADAAAVTSATNLTGSGAFNNAGALQRDTAASSGVTDLGKVSAYLNAWQAALDTATKTLNQAIELGGQNLAPLREDVRRLTAARDHVQNELTRLTTVVGRANNVVTGLPSSPATDPTASVVISSFRAEQAKVNSARTVVRSAVTSLETARDDIKSDLGMAGTYLEQLVALRTYEKSQADAAVTAAGGPNSAPQFLIDDAKKKAKVLTEATETRDKHIALGADGNPAGVLVDALLETRAAHEDDGQALADAISAVHGSTVENKKDLDTLKGQLTDEDGNPIDLSDLGSSDAVMALTATDDPDTMEDETGPITRNANDIETLEGTVTNNGTDLDKAWMDLYGSERGVEAQHDNLAACEATGVLNVANCANARSLHNKADIEDVQSDIDDVNDLIEAETTDRKAADEALGGRIDKNAADIAAETTARMEADMDLGMRIDGEAATRMEADMMLAGGIDANTAAIGAEEMARKEADTALGGRISSNADAIAANMNSIGQNASAISDNRNRIGELSDDLDVVRAGVAASMALAGMPAINGRGIAIGVGSYDGESAFAVGFQIQGEQASFKIGVTSSGGETGASAGVGFNF